MGPLDSVAVEAINCKGQRVMVIITLYNIGCKMSCNVTAIYAWNYVAFFLKIHFTACSLYYGELTRKKLSC